MEQIKTYSSYDSIPKEQWNGLLEKSPYKSFFQSQECYDFFDGLSFLKAFVFGVSEDNELKGIIAGYIQKDGGKIKSYLSRRAIINAGPLLAENITPEALQALLSTCTVALKHKVIYVETRNFFDYSKYRGVFEQCGFRYEPHLNFQIDTSSEEVVMQNMGKSRKRDIKVSLRDGAVIEENPTDEDVKQYFAILQDLYKAKVRTPLFPFEFFECLYKSDCGHLLLIKYDNRVIGGTICVGLPKSSLYEWFTCGEDGIYKNIHASTIAVYAGIQYAYNNSYHIFDMMGAGKPDEKYGVRDFKAKFGGQLVEYGRYLYILNRTLFSIGKLGVRILKRIK